MSTFTFQTRDSQFGFADGVTQTMVLPLSECPPRTPTSFRTDTQAMSGAAGATRFRGSGYEGRMTLPYIPQTILPTFIDFTEAMKYGYSNPFFFDGTDMFGHYISFYAMVIDTKIDTPNVNCKIWTSSFSYREVQI